MSERTIFKMPDDPELFLAALAAVQGWRQEMDQQLQYGEEELQKVGVHNERWFNEKKIPFGKYQMMIMSIEEANRRHADRYYELSISADWSRYETFQPALGPNVQFLPLNYRPKRGEWQQPGAPKRVIKQYVPKEKRVRTIKPVDGFRKWVGKREKVLGRYLKNS